MLCWLAACVQPIQPTPTPAPTAIASPTPPAPPPTGPTFPPDTVGTFLAVNYGASPSDLTLFTQFSVGPDEIMGYRYTDATGQTCAGFAQAAANPPTVWNADFRCSPPGTQLTAGSTLFALTNGEFYVVAFGYVDPNTAPNANAYAVTFPNGDALTNLLTNNGFVALRPGLDLPTQVNIITPEGNTVLTAPLQ
ncbi:MAG: hypothetical protein ACLFTK_00745 [Anaerolineales bacterium]